jgi:NitT/TauT family transport system permease protein
MAIYDKDIQSAAVLVALFVCLAPTTIGGLLSAIGIAGMDRMVQRNVLAMSGRAVEAAGDCSTLLLDKTGTITYGNRMAEKVLLPVLDILQSVPVLGFLSVTVTVFINLFPGSELGLERGSIFAIFTAMAWNLTFAFYYSLISQPRELDEAARVMRLTNWQRFWRLDVPSGMIPLVWNGMMSFGGAWFFLAASESISVLNHTYALPGIGSYVAAAIAHGNLGEVGIAIGVMIIMVIGVNVLFWRPMTAWAEKFRVEESEAAERPRSLVLDLLRRSEVPHLIGRPLRPAGRWLDRATRPLGLAEHPLGGSPARERTADVFFGGAIAALVIFGAWKALDYVHVNLGLGAFGQALLLGAGTFARVVVLTIAATVVWVPIGVWIGMNPKVTRFAQPVVQVLASFPRFFCSRSRSSFSSICTSR